MPILSSDEIETLKNIETPRADIIPCRTHIEKFFRLDLIEPYRRGLALSEKGKEFLFGCNATQQVA